MQGFKKQKNFKPLAFYLLSVSFLASVLLTSQAATAQSFKVLKIQGKKAIVEISDPNSVSLNQTYNVGSGSDSSSSSSGSPSSGLKSGVRKYGVGGNFEFSSLKSDLAGASATDTMAFNAMLLWNFRLYEVGPILGYSTVSVGSAKTSSTSMGGTAYYNFQENKPGTDQIFSALGSLMLTSNTPSTGSSSSGTLIEVGGSYRWFLLSSDHCLSFSGIYSMEKTKVNSADTTISGFKLLAGISTYF